jgi:hypothetical protein
MVSVLTEAPVERLPVGQRWYSKQEGFIAHRNQAFGWPVFWDQHPDPLVECARRTCEGAYQIHTLPFHALAVFETLSGIRTEVEDPFLAASAYACSAPTQPHERAAIDQAEAAMLAHPPNASGVK